ncbi:DNA translocase FtsK [Neisseriaceae bacterium B1]
MKKPARPKLANPISKKATASKSKKAKQAAVQPNIAPAKPKKTAAQLYAAKVQTVAHTPRSDNSRQLIGDTKWLFGVVATIYFAVSLFSFRMVDPSWSRSIAALGEVGNWGGLLGAYLSDVVYYLFGLSAWWMVAAMVFGLYRKFRPFAERGMQAYNPKVAGVGLLIMLVCSPVIEFYALSGWLKNSLPLGAGGWMGTFVASGLSDVLGATLGLLIIFIAALLALSLMVQISWLDFLERLGMGLERMMRNTYQAIFGDDKPKQPENDSAQLIEEVEVLPISAAVPITTPKPKGSNSNRKIQVTVAAPPMKSNRTQQAQPIVTEGEYQLPDISCLKTPDDNQPTADQAQLRETAALIEAKLAEFGIEVSVVSATAGPVITRFEIEPAKGVKGSQIVNLSKDLARSMATQSVRVVETIVGKNTMGIEVPNDFRQEVLLQEIFSADVFTQAASKLTVALGKDIAGLPVVGDLAKMPHLLVGGMTGSGKSVGVNAMILSMLYKAKPDEVRFIMIDPKMLELSVYEGIPHLLCPVVTDMREAGNALNWCVTEMEKRYRLLAHQGVRTLASFNEKIQAAKDAEKPIPNPFSLNPDDPEPLEKLPQIVVVIDELADLMMTEKKAVETQIARLAQKARAAGIHMIIATQRPSVDVITGLIKANVPTRMAFTVQSRIDSRTILDQMGAEDLLKYGDLLFLQPGNAEPTRLQGAFVSDDEVHEVVSFIKAQAEPNYVDGLLTGEAASETNSFINPDALSGSSDELFDQAVQFVISSRKASISSLQRHLRIGYNRAANLMQDLEDQGIVSPAEIDGKRTVLARADMLG